MQSVWIGDLEGDGLLDTVTTIWCGVFKNVNTQEVVKFSPKDGKDYIQKMLNFLDSIDVLVMHNGIGYDYPALEKLYGYKFLCKKIDTLIMSRMLYPNALLPPNNPFKGKVGPHSVECWGYKLGRWKPEHNDWSQFSDDMLHRCTEDVEIQYLLYKKLKKKANEGNWMQPFRMSFRLFEILQKQEQYGWKVDQPYMDKCIGLLDHWMNRVDRIIQPYLPYTLVVGESKVKGEYRFVSKPFTKAGKLSAQSIKWLDIDGNCVKPSDISGCFSRIEYRRISLDSNMETKEFLLGAGWIPKEWNIKKVDGKPVKDERGNYIKTSPKLSHDDPFIGIQGAVGRLIARRVQCRHRRSTIIGWKEIVRDDGAIGARVTGIASTARMKHGGIVNVPNGEAFFGKQMRRCFIARDGMVLVGCDSAGCQNRMLAARVGDPEFTKILLEGSKENKTSIHYVNQKAIKDVAGIDVSYGQAKTLNYAFIFGASDNKLGVSIGKGKAEGERIRKALLSVSAGFEKLVDSLTKEWKSNAKRRVNDWGKTEYYNGWVTGLDGRPILIASEHQILVYVLQSDEAIMMSAAYCMVYQRLLKAGYKWGKDFGIVCFYHDEYTIECREEIAQDVAKIAEQCIVDAGLFFKIQCPHEGDANIGKDWYEIH